MSIGKIIGLGSAAIVVILMIYILMQGGSTPADVKETVGVAEFKSAAKPKSEEEKKLEELEEKAKELSYAETSKLFASKCVACHGRNGEGRILGPAGASLAPSIKGKSEEYIMERLEEYRQNRVENTLMKGLLNNSSDEELRALAKEIASFE
ncbi:MAG: c-type cytochrome [Campylobacteraceae bacterium]|nr:c-type cytochrome [Campylobacteraceae bacterium]